jgi:hypothetical protein
MEALKKKKREIGYALIQPEMETDPLFKYDCERLAEKVENEYNAINRLYLNTVKEVNRIHNELKQSELPLFRISLNGCIRTSYGEQNDTFFNPLHFITRFRYL